MLDTLRDFLVIEAEVEADLSDEDCECWVDEEDAVRWG